MMWNFLQKNREGIQIGLSILMFITGVVLAFMGFWVIPVGDVTNSVLIIVGQFLVAGGTLLGVHIPSLYKNRQQNLQDKE